MMMSLSLIIIFKHMYCSFDMNIKYVLNIVHDTFQVAKYHISKVAIQMTMCLATYLAPRPGLADGR